jgi:hypothetical protein
LTVPLNTPSGVESIGLQKTGSKTSGNTGSTDGGNTAARTINITINGQPTTLRLGSEAEADALTRIIQQLTSAQKVST